MKRCVIEKTAFITKWSALLFFPPHSSPSLMAVIFWQCRLRFHAWNQTPKHDTCSTLYLKVTRRKRVCQYLYEASPLRDLSAQATDMSNTVFPVSCFVFIFHRRCFVLSSLEHLQSHMQPSSDIWAWSQQGHPFRGVVDLPFFFRLKKPPIVLATEDPFRGVQLN